MIHHHDRPREVTLDGAVRGDATEVERLCDWIRARAGMAGPCRVLDTRNTSRNTLIYRLGDSRTTFIGKVPLRLGLEGLETQHDHLLRLCEILRGEAVEPARPLGVCRAPVALVMHEASGTSMYELVGDHFRQGAPRRLDHGDLPALVTTAGRGLAMIHTRMSGHPVGSVRDVVWLYRDYAPKNVLCHKVGDAWALTLLDAPERAERGFASLDLGVFCFELTRAALVAGGPRVLLSNDLRLLKDVFLRAYCEEVGLRYNAGLIAAARGAERRRAYNAAAWYARFWRHRNWWLEMGRGFALGSSVLLYAFLGLPLTYRRPVAR